MAPYNTVDIILMVSNPVRILVVNDNGWRLPQTQLGYYKDERRDVVRALSKLEDTVNVDVVVEESIDITNIAVRGTLKPINVVYLSESEDIIGRSTEGCEDVCWKLVTREFIDEVLANSGNSRFEMSLILQYYNIK